MPSPHSPRDASHDPPRDPPQPSPPRPAAERTDQTRALEASYDELPYESHALRYSHPDTLATVAALAGLAAPAVDRCRVLELGCAEGGNLIPLADHLPHGTFVGVDLSARQVEAGQALIEAAGLGNIELRAASITDIDDSWGTFDYVLCHGVFSWVPDAVADHILTVCSRNLAPGGLAYVSYNTYPGWHLRGITRDMLLYHVGRMKQRAGPRLADRRAQAAVARDFLGFMAQAARNQFSYYSDILKNETDLLAKERDSYLYHEYLEEVNRPLYFHQFADRLAGKGLQWVGEPTYGSPLNQVAAEAADTLGRLAGDRLAREQYLDFVRNRAFRRSVLAHADRPLAESPDWRAVRSMRLAAVLRPEDADPDLRPGAPATFAAPDEPTLTTAEPPLKAALLALARAWPEAPAFDELARQVGGLLRAAPGARGPDVGASGHDTEDRDALAQAMLRCYLSGVVELHAYVPPFVTTPGARPRAGRVARIQSAWGLPLANRRHRTVGDLTDFDLLVLRHLDGTRDRAGLLDALAGDGALQLQGDEGRPIADPARIRPLLEPQLEPALARLALSALLIE